MDAWRERVIEEAKGWLRTPWVHRARVKGAGVDCAQLLIAVYSGAGVIEAFDTGEYPADWMLHREEERFLSWVKKFMSPIDSPQPADIVIWKYGRCFSHAAIVVDWPVVIHSFKKEGGVVWGNASQGDLARHQHVAYSRKAA